MVQNFIYVFFFYRSGILLLEIKQHGFCILLCLPNGCISLLKVTARKGILYEYSGFRGERFPMAIQVIHSNLDSLEQNRFSAFFMLC